MKKLIQVTIGLMIVFGAGLAQAQTDANPTVPNQVVMVPYEAYNEAPSAFSFAKLSQDEHLTKNDYDILFEGTSIDTIMVVDQVGQLVDLGDVSCVGRTDQGAKQVDVGPNSMTALMYSSAFEKLQLGEGKSSLTPATGHCYLLYRTDSIGREVALFHVKIYIPNQILIIDQIRVFDHSRFVNGQN